MIHAPSVPEKKELAQARLDDARLLAQVSGRDFLLALSDLQTRREALTVAT